MGMVEEPDLGWIEIRERTPDGDQVSGLHTEGDVGLSDVGQRGCPVVGEIETMCGSDLAHGRGGGLPHLGDRPGTRDHAVVPLDAAGDGCFRKR